MPWQDKDVLLHDALMKNTALVSEIEQVCNPFRQILFNPPPGALLHPPCRSFHPV